MSDTEISLTSTEREELEHLREKVAQFEDIVRCLPIGLIFVDEHDNVSMANPIGAEIRCVGDRLGASVEDCHPEGTHGTLEKVMDKFRTEPQMQEHPIVLERMHRYEVTYSRVAKPNGDYRGVLWLSHDISRRKQLERELLHAERLAGLGRMAAKVAHDIRNPLNAIQGAAHYLRQQEAEFDQGPELTSLIMDQVARISALVTHLNELTRPFQLKTEDMDLRAFLEKQVEASSVAMPDLHWNLTVEDDVPETVRVDEGLLERLVGNTVENASLSMDGRGELQVRVRHWTEEDGGWIEMEFEDEGPGFPPQVMEHLFQPFLTTRPNGTGLGLTIMREICRLHGGDLSIENIDGGALVTARLSAR